MDPAALREQLAACHDDSFAWALGCCGRDRREAEDVLQAVYLKVLDGRARYEGRSSFRTWLFAVIRRTAADFRRRAVLRALRLVALGPGDEPAHGAIAADELVESAERSEQLSRCLARLPRRQREVLLLVFYHGHAVEEAAEVMRIGVGSARKHYARGKDRLRALLEESGWTKS